MVKQFEMIVEEYMNDEEADTISEIIRKFI